jgi:cyanate lyase
MPILAGAYQLMLSKQFYEKIRERKFILKKMVKSKFSGIIGPDMVFKLELKQMKEDKGEHRISLKILVEEKTVTAVKMTLQEV